MRARAGTALGLAVVAVSWGAPLARLTDAAPLAVAMWRMVLAVALLAPIGLARTGGVPSREGRRAAMLASLFLGLHFGLWIPSLWLTSVAASVVLVSTAPLFVLLLSPHFLGVSIRARNLASFALALCGVTLISWGDLQLSTRALAGDAMALAAAGCMAGYLVAGKRVRAQVRLSTYLTAVYGGAALVLVVAVVVLGVEVLPRTAISWLPLLAMALGPTLTGHTLLNWALAHVEAYKVNLTVLLEPVLAAAWAWLVLAEAPPLHVLPGAALVLLAVGLEYLPDSRQKAQAISCQ